MKSERLPAGKTVDPGIRGNRGKFEAAAVGRLQAGEAKEPLILTHERNGKSKPRQAARALRTRRISTRTPHPNTVSSTDSPGSGTTRTLIS